MLTGDRQAQWIESRGLETELSRVISHFKGAELLRPRDALGLLDEVDFDTVEERARAIKARLTSVF